MILGWLFAKGAITIQPVCLIGNVLFADFKKDYAKYLEEAYD